MVRERVIKRARTILEKRRELFKKLAEEHKYLKK